jgi:hypothetical protein
MNNLPIQIIDTIKSIKRIAPPPGEIWLVGSQANGYALPESDWDLLIFGSPAFFMSLKNDRSLKRKELDLLVVCDGDNFRNPFRRKLGSLKAWSWKRDGDGTASYIGRKWAETEEDARRFRCERGELLDMPSIARRLDVLDNA